MSEHIISTIEVIERIIKQELNPSIHKRDEQACLMRIQANIAELKFLIKDSMERK